MNCNICDDKILGDDDHYYTMHRRNPMHFEVSRIQFCKKCFSDIAGESFIEDLTPGNFNHPDLTSTEIEYVNAGRIISAVKELRARTGLGLKESKDIVDAFRNAK